MSRIRFSRSITLTVFLMVLSEGWVGAQQAAITGRVTDVGTGQLIAGAQLAVVGSNIGSLTNSAGTYTIRSVTPGNVTVRVLILGYAEQSQPVALTAGQTATLNFELRPTAIILAPVVATATGEQRRIEVGNAIAHVNAAEVVQTRAVSTVADLLTSRAAGVMVIPGTQT
ncbi:MAG: carboxypeptidase-like regulatory domain-containing protein, partial [Longimicrobiales bacterium]